MLLYVKKINFSSVFHSNETNNSAVNKQVYGNQWITNKNLFSYSI